MRRSLAEPKSFRAAARNMPGSFLTGTGRQPEARHHAPNSGLLLPIRPGRRPELERTGACPIRKRIKTDTRETFTQARRTKRPIPISPFQRAIWADAGRDPMSGGRTGEFGRDIGGGPTLVNWRVPQSCRRLRVLCRNSIVAMTTLFGRVSGRVSRSIADLNRATREELNQCLIKS